MQRAISEAYERLDRRKGMATPDGIMSDAQARAKGVGGEVIGTVA